jgi:hypothetical protein
VAALLASPCAAAEDRIGWQATERRGGAFAGLAVGMKLGAKRTARPEARLRLGMAQHHRAAGAAAPLRMVHGSAVELRLAKGKPMLFVGGRSGASLRQRARLDGGDTWLYVAGGVAVAAAAFLLLAGDGSDAEPCIPGNC